MRLLLRTAGSRPRRVKQRVGAWLAVAGWIALILTLGGESFSASSTSRLIGPLLHWLFPDITAESLATAHFLVRKGAHVTEYGVLALLAWRALQLSFRISRGRIGAGTLGFVLAVAGTDEAFQAFSRLPK